MEKYLLELQELEKDLKELDKIDAMAIDDMMQRFEQYDIEASYLKKLADEIDRDKTLTAVDKDNLRKMIDHIKKEYLTGVVEEERLITI